MPWCCRGVRWRALDSTNAATCLELQPRVLKIYYELTFVEEPRGRVLFTNNRIITALGPQVCSASPAQLILSESIRWRSRIRSPLWLPTGTGLLDQGKGTAEAPFASGVLQRLTDEGGVNLRPTPYSHTSLYILSPVSCNQTAQECMQASAWHACFLVRARVFAGRHIPR